VSSEHELLKSFQSVTMGITSNLRAYVLDSVAEESIESSKVAIQAEQAQRKSSFHLQHLALLQS
jgi:hypothetical protein